MTENSATIPIAVMLAGCPRCQIRYVIAPDPFFVGQWIFYERDHSMEQPTHIGVGGPLCLRGHALEVKAKEAAITAEGPWLSLGAEHPAPEWN